MGKMDHYVRSMQRGGGGDDCTTLQPKSVRIADHSADLNDPRRREVAVIYLGARQPHQSGQMVVGIKNERLIASWDHSDLKKVLTELQLLHDTIALVSAPGEGQGH